MPFGQPDYPCCQCKGARFTLMTRMVLQALRPCSQWAIRAAREWLGGWPAGAKHSRLAKTAGSDRFIKTETDGSATRLKRT